MGATTRKQTPLAGQAKSSQFLAGKSNEQIKAEKEMQPQKDINDWWRERQRERALRERMRNF